MSLSSKLERAAGRRSKRLRRAPGALERLGYRAAHETTVIAKQLVQTFYEQPLNHSYFNGCSTGGEQALMEAERFPEDYDGIVGGAPAHNRTGVNMSILRNHAVMERDPASYIPAAKLPALAKTVSAACGGKDGVIADPTKCFFEPATHRRANFPRTHDKGASSIGIV